MRTKAAGMSSPITPVAALSGGGLGKPPIMAMHDGGTVPKDGTYELEKGEKVVAAKKEEKSDGRNSEYRKVYLARKNKK